MRLGSEKHHTVFEGEGIGLILGLELIREEEWAEGMVSIGIDNVAAISATHTIKLSSSHYIWDIFHRRVTMLYNKHKGLDLLVRWTPGHTGIAGNEKADEEAKKAAREGSSARNILPAPLRKRVTKKQSHSASGIQEKTECNSTKPLEKFTKICQYGTTVPKIQMQHLREDNT